MVVAILYLLFFLSGAAALVYQLLWVRSLTLVFGGSHLAVTAVLAIFMGGLALGSYLAGRRIDRVGRLLRLYGLLELGIAAAALLVAGLMHVYPSFYATLARGRDDAAVYLTAIRVLFSIAALIVPTMLMGATLPVVSRFLASQPRQLRRHLSFLYGVNTLGAVVGAIVTSFVLLRIYTVSTTLYVAVATNVAIGLASLALQRRVEAAPSDRAVAAEPQAPPTDSEIGGAYGLTHGRLLLWGIGLSGFCALGYEVLWTRILTMAVGASVYGFTIMLVAFLTGIALGSHAYGMLARLGADAGRPNRLLAWFGITQMLVGVTALLVTLYLRDVPVNAVRLQSYFASAERLSFAGRTWASFGLAFLYMLVPALLMGAAFPMAAEALARFRRATGRGVGDALAANTLGAVLGAATSGLLLIGLFGIERSLQFLTMLNAGLGLMILASLATRRWALAAAALGTLGALTFLALDPGAVRMWDRKYFAIFRSNQPDAFQTPEMVQEALDNTDVLYFAEGNSAIVSVIKVKGGEQAFVTNGRVEASAHTQAQQVQLTLGHLPVLLARDPKDVLVVGLGSGMTAGATTVHPGVQSVTLVELEPKVVGVARTFEAYNHRVLDSPKLRVVFNDGRNYLATTDRQFDVITADPIHPWFKGAGSLYATEYFDAAARHLRPGGVIAQWLPIYELTSSDLASVARTVQQHFPHTMLWLSHSDAVIVGSAAPFDVDEAELARRLAEPSVAADLSRVTMGSVVDLLSYFVMGTAGLKRFAQNGTVNSDDRPYLEYSAPFSIADPTVMAANVAALGAHRESLLPYVKAQADPVARQAQEERWGAQETAGKMGDRALALYLGQGATDPDFRVALRQLNLEYPTYAPGRALWAEYETAAALEPRLLSRETFHLMGSTGAMFVELSAVLVPVSKTRASVMFVDNRTRTIYGQAYLDDYLREDRAVNFASGVMAALRDTYTKLAEAAKQHNGGLPAAPATLQGLTAVINAKVKSVQ